MGKQIVFIVYVAALFVPFVSFAQNTVAPDTVTFQKARVAEVLEHKTEVIAGTETPAQTQMLRAEILDGPQAGTEVTFENDYVQLAADDVFYARHLVNDIDGTDYWSVADAYRLNVLATLAIAFVALIFIFGGVQGIRGLASLVGSLLLIFYLLIPGIYGGHSPILVSIGVSSLIIFVGSYITHGVNHTTTSAVIGMIVTVIFTGLAAYWVVEASHLSGYTDDTHVYLNFDTKGTIDMVGLLFGGIMIGLLGVLYDSAIGQAVAIEELFRAGSTSMTRGLAYRRGIRIGREHIGALVNTLAIAYVGASLPLLLLIQSSDASPLFILNSEVFATEIIRILIGSIGLILSVPITTLVAVYLLAGRVDVAASAHSHSHAYHHR